MPHLEDVDGSLWDYFGISSQPAWILFDVDGRVTRGRGALPDQLFKLGLTVARYEGQLGFGYVFPRN
ncbi:MAG: hypothetical protein ACJZ6C_03970 [Candidatus Poriferisodalaceae bacterium]